MDRCALERLVQEATGARAVRTGERVQQLWGGYGEIRRFALEGGDAPSVIVKRVAPPVLATGASGEEKRSHARKLRSYEVEHVFYRDFAARCDERCRVPRLYDARFDLLARAPARDGSMLFVLEDLDAAGYARRRNTLSPDELGSCLDWLAHFHARFLAVEPAGLFAEGSYWHLGTRPDELRRLRDSALREAAPALDAQLSKARFRTVIHGDAKVENFCFAARGAVAALDFQYAGGGVGVKDVAYFFASCLDSAGCEKHAPMLLDHYFETLRRAVRVLHPALDACALEAEWRALYPVAWADFMRFLLGWAPGEAREQAYGRRLLQQSVSKQS